MLARIPFDEGNCQPCHHLNDKAKYRARTSISIGTRLTVVQAERLNLRVVPREALRASSKRLQSHCG